MMNDKTPMMLKIPNNLLSDGMILQRDLPVKIWGVAAHNAPVSIEADWLMDHRETSCDAQGHWEITLEASSSQKSHQIVISSGLEKLRIQDILFGEVWLASGQSNMEMPLDGEIWDFPIYDADKHISEAHNPNIRMFMIDKATQTEPGEVILGTWQETTPENIKEFSASGYFFAKNLHETLNVPIGIINASMSATAIESWSPQASVQRLGVAYDYDAPDDLEPAFPSGLYNGVIHPLRHYAIKGVIWYQGESNVAWSEAYRLQFPEMISAWRSLWGLGDFPFYFVQLAPYVYETPGQVALLRDAQTQTFRSVDNTGMVVITDLGDPNDVHPRAKAPVGQRLAKWALAKTYGQRDIVFSGPHVKQVHREGSQLRLEFEAWSLTGSLMLVEVSASQFELADVEGDWHSASVRIDDQDLLIHCDKVKNPMALRYAWSDFPETQLTNAEGLPATPFLIKVEDLA